MTKWFILPLNPQPWTTGRISAGKRNGKITGRLSPDHQLQIFQNAVREELDSVEQLPAGKYELKFYFWRQLESFEHEGKKSRSHIADATNLQKGLEDALQGILFDNDRDVARITSTIVDQSPTTVPYVVIQAGLWSGLDPNEIPDSIWSDMDEKSIEISFEDIAADLHNYHTDEDLF